MDGGASKNIEKLDDDLWTAADNVRANSKPTSSDRHQADYRLLTADYLFGPQSGNPMRLSSARNRGSLRSGSKTGLALR